MEIEAVEKGAFRLLSGLRVRELFRTFGESHEVRDGVWYVLVEQTDLENSLAGRKRGMRHLHIIVIMGLVTP